MEVSMSHRRRRRHGRHGIKAVETAPAAMTPAAAASSAASAPPVPMRTIVRRFWPYARRYRPWLLLTAVFITLDAAIETAAVFLFKVLVDEVLVPRDFHALVWVGALFVPATVAGGIVSFGDDVL